MAKAAVKKNVQDLPKQGSGVITSRSTDIIGAILGTSFDGVVEAIDENPANVRSIHPDSGMDATMLACIGRLPDFVEFILDSSAFIDFSHTDNDGRTHLEVAVLSMEPKIIQAVITALETHAPQHINN